MMTANLRLSFSSQGFTSWNGHIGSIHGRNKENLEEDRNLPTGWLFMYIFPPHYSFPHWLRVVKRGWNVIGSATWASFQASPVGWVALSPKVSGWHSICPIGPTTPLGLLGADLVGLMRVNSRCIWWVPTWACLSLQGQQLHSRGQPRNPHHAYGVTVACTAMEPVLHWQRVGHQPEEMPSGSEPTPWGFEIPVPLSPPPLWNNNRIFAELLGYSVDAQTQFISNILVRQLNCWQLWNGKGWLTSTLGEWMQKSWQMVLMNRWRAISKITVGQLGAVNKFKQEWCKFVLHSKGNVKGPFRNSC